MRLTSKGRYAVTAMLDVALHSSEGPVPLADISELVRIGNTAITENDLAALQKSASEVRGALGILGCDPFDPIFANSSSAKSEVLDGLISLALEQRNAARARKDFAASDKLRDQLLKLGISIKDSPSGQEWDWI